MDAGAEGGGGLADFGARGAGEQLAEDFRGGYAIHHVGDGAEDGHFDVMGGGDCEGDAGGVDAFGDHAGVVEDGGEGAAFGEFDADAAVAAELAGAGEDEVAEAGEAGDGGGLAAEGNDEAGHFGKAASDEGSEAVGAELEAFDGAGGDGDAVFKGASEFDSDEIGIGV